MYCFGAWEEGVTNATTGATFTTFIDSSIASVFSSACACAY
jgi:hypothetical protein